jgi:uncharacterized protein GlcG (DUF336 family)
MGFFRTAVMGLSLGMLLGGCSGGGNSGDPIGTAPPAGGGGDGGCVGQCANATTFLGADDVRRVIAQAVNEAQALSQPATIAVVDRVGNVLAVYRMSGARTTVTITSGRGVVGGLENLAIVPSELAAISKAVTGAFLSSEGNAFSTRTASQIVQEHFNPREFNAPSGPLFGVQFSQLLCSDVIQLPAPVLAGVLAPGASTTVGPKTSPLGLSADAGGFPLYKSGTVVGGIGVVADGTYGLDPNISDRDRDADELIATAGSFGFAAPLDRRGDRITADGKTFRFSDVDFADLTRDPSAAPAFATLPASAGQLLALFAFTDGSVQAGVAFGTPASGIRADAGDYPGTDAFVLVDGDGQPRFRPRAGTDGTGALTAIEAQRIVQEALTIANRARAQIRRPTGSQARVSIGVVDRNGELLALARTRDAPVFGTDVAVQKARSASFFSGTFAAAELGALPNARYLGANGSASGTEIDFDDYVAATRMLLGNDALTGTTAFTPRALGLIARPYFPDGIVGTANGPLSKPFASWSPFSDGLQLDLAFNQVAEILVAYLGADAAPILALRPEGGSLGCTRNPRLRNGIQIFPGAVPIYRGNTLVGAVGVSGDGIDQDDMIAFLGLHNAAAALNSGIGNAPNAMRADRLVPMNSRLRYVQCPQAPFNGSNEQNVCEGK